MNKKIVLSALTFMLAIGGAFASQFLAPEQGYSRKTGLNSIPEQQFQCEERETCDNVEGPLCFNLEDIVVETPTGPVTYTPGTVQLFKLTTSPTTSCNIPLFRP